MKFIKYFSLIVPVAFALFFAVQPAHAEIVRERGNGVVWYINRADGHRYQLSMNAQKMFEQIQYLSVPVSLDVLFSDSLVDPTIRSASLKTCALPKSIDTDQDCIDNAFEKAILSNPNSKDTDGDGYSDFTELMTGHSLTRPASQSNLVPEHYKYIPSLEARLKGVFVMETQNQNEIWYVKKGPYSNYRVFVNSPALLRSQVYLKSPFVTHKDVLKFPLGKWLSNKETDEVRQTYFYPQTLPESMSFKDTSKTLLDEAIEIKNR